jgi:prophage tail gpP-like protein
MTVNINDVTLLINGVAYGGWKSVRISAGIERLARDFDLEVTSQWPGSNIEQRIQKGDACEVFIGTDLMLTGYVDATPIRYDSSSVSVGIKGRSKTADLVDCCPVNVVPAGGWSDVDNGKGGPRPLTQRADGQWNNRKLEKIAAYLAKPYQISVIAQVDTGPVIREEMINPGETVFEILDRMMRKNHVLCTDDANGDMVIITAGSGGRCTTALELGKNILSGNAPLDYKAVFTRYTCVGQRAVQEGEDQSVAFSGSASVTDTSIFGVGRMRALLVTQTGQADEGTCRDRVNYEKAYRAGKALETDYTVAGWRQDDGTLWLPNRLVRVRDGKIGFDVDLLISEVTYTLDKDGMRTDLKVGPLSGFLSKVSNQVKPNWNEVVVK